ncbi:MAG: A/G-specific adenine glycosylase [Puniceicoccales bacterium]|jgi:A/G-specific adenine glycosylase|nr:A/G-specific adenine glycosylase [Puniceicoccales bacterium]
MDTSAIAPRRVREFRRALLAWFAHRRRAMPWRDAPTLYKTVVSEFMLQQTQVATVIPYFERWLARWPDFHALAAAAESNVVKAWEGLGYYSRARNLRRLAAAVAAMPAPPRAAADWQKLPGVGPYTAAAIASIAGGEPVAVVDGNVVRVTARLLADTREFADTNAAAKALADAARALLDPDDPGSHNQAMMELGALVCRPRQPLCAECPVKAFCKSTTGGGESKRAGGGDGGVADGGVGSTGSAGSAAPGATAGATASADALPPFFAPRQIRHVAIARAWVVHAGRLLLYRHAGTARRLAGLRELPPLETLTDTSVPTAGTTGAAVPADTASPVPPVLGRIAAATATTGGTVFLARRRRAISNQQIEETFWQLTPTPALLRRIAANPALEWVALDALPAITLSGPHRRWVSELLATKAL